MINRLVDALYWMGRYAERAENTARIVDVNYHASMQLSGSLSNYNQDSGNDPFSLNPWAPTEPESMVEWLILDRENPSSVAASLEQCHENAQTARNKIDEESWKCLNRAYLEYASPDPDILDDERLHEYCRNVIRIIHEFTGTLESTMFRGEGWYYLSIGRQIERADNSLRQLEVFMFESDRQASKQLKRSKNRLFLESIGGTTLLQNHETDLLEDAGLIRDFLLRSDESPRALLFLLNAINENLKALHDAFYPNLNLQYVELNELIQSLQSDQSDFKEKKSYSDWIRMLAELSDSIFEEFRRKSSKNNSATQQQIQTQ